ncbi:hypothetical protein [Deferribacter abyssi]|uniref:hypothetical protein n=1 Tax=Deferribacter abyssi TaxID=213806 RepID=UPI003C2A9D0D
MMKVVDKKEKMEKGIDDLLGDRHEWVDMEKKEIGNGENQTGARIAKRTFKPGVVVSEFDVNFLDEGKCRKYLLEIFYPEGARCPICGKLVPEKSVQRFWENKKMKCPYCGKFYFATSKTVLSAKKLSFRQIYLIALFLGLGVNPYKIAELVGCDKKIVYYWRGYFEGLEVKHG